MLRKTTAVMAQSLACIFNHSLTKCKFPSTWKIANMTPLHKKDDKQNRKNYRLISLLSIIGKCLLRCICNSLYNYFQENNIISHLQSAYTSGNLRTQLLDIYHRTLEAMDEGKEIRFLFMDISNAFDLVWHKGIINKFRKVGIGGGRLEWIKDYLSNRKQRVVVKRAESMLMDILAGVPQEILGLILFILYVNDIVNIVNLEV